MNINSKRILLVEDDATVGSLYRSLLERAGAKVRVVTDGSDAFMEAHHQVYDLMLLDVMLPSMDGIAILGRLRAQKRFALIPIFVYSSGDLAQIEPLALEAGATRVFSKSTSPKEVVAAIVEQVGAASPAPGQPVEMTGETDHRSKGDFRVQPKEAPQLPPLRMKEPVQEPLPPPRPPAPRPPKVTLHEEPEPEKKGLLSRLFSKRSKETDE